MGSNPSTPADLASAINGFGNSLFQKVAAESNPGDSPGLFLSPYGIAQAMAMVLNGVEPGGQSYRQLQEVIYGLPAGSEGLGVEALNEQLHQLSSALVKEPSEDLTVSDANSAWLRKELALQPGYAQALQEAFGAVARPLTSAAAVNSWVSEATRGKISSIVDEDAVRQAVLVLVNAVYFKGLWLHKFKKTATVPAPFRLLQAGAEPLQAATMFNVYKPSSAIQVAELPAQLEGAGQLACPAVRLPYRGGEYYAVAAMPGGDFSTAAAQGGQLGLVTPGGATVPYSQALAACRQALLANLPKAQTNSSIKGSDSGQLWKAHPRSEVKLYLPRFEVEFSTSLTKALMGLGVVKPFQGGDITKIAADSSGKPVDNLLVSDVVHKVYAKVDEAGTEAAAATGVIMMRSAMLMPKEEVVLRFDRPFVFAVVHGPSGLALFCGEVYKPEEWKEDGAQR